MPHERRVTHLLCGKAHVRGDGFGDDEAIACLATAQHGVVARGQLLQLGVSKRAIEHRVRVGRLRRLHRATYAVGHEATSHTGRIVAAVMAISGGAPSRTRVAASHTSAASLWGLCDPLGASIHVSATQPRRHRLGIAVHRAVLPREEVGLAAGVPVTSVARTLLDLSSVTGARALRRLVKRAEFEGLTDGATLSAILARYPRRPGRQALANLVEAYVIGAGRTRSELEDRFLSFVARRRLPHPESNVPIEVRGERFEVDFVWREPRLIVELDGWQAHRTDAAFQEDRRRDRALIAGGWSPMRVTWAQLHMDPDKLEAEIRDALATLGAHRRGLFHTGGG